MKTILVPLMGLGSDKAALEVAGHVAAPFRSHIAALHTARSTATEVANLTLGQGVMSQDLCDEIEAEIQARKMAAEDAFKTFCRDRHHPIVSVQEVQREVSASWRQTVGELTDEVVACGRRRDLVVMTRDVDTFGTPATVLGEIITRLGRPLLLVPKDPPCIGRTVAIAWKNTIEGAHALTAAMPLVALADHLVILVAPEDGSDAAEVEANHLASQLRWLPAEVSLKFCPPGLGATSSALVSGARSAHADLIVMGGYGHSRARELVLGGVTRDLLKHCAVPLLITH